ncbi:MAG: CocE/NonD family hydrolase [Planctomycetota bacterium]|nr:MAG: CocE/NonD family hydrolase [Planctomycetota bacterium]
MHPLLAAVAFLVPSAGFQAQTEQEPSAELRQRYVKREVMIPMRDGVRLFTSIYAPKDSAQQHPILLCRTPYSVAPYGADRFRERLGPHDAFALEGYAFAYQDVRGCYMSEGVFDNMRPTAHALPGQVDESTDTWDTIDWLVQNVPGNNGRVGMWGISYPGFYAAAGMIDAHPALKAVSPQAPIADWFWDDFHHHGALWLPHTFNFFASFGRPRPQPVQERGGRFRHGTPDGYEFFLDLGPLRNADERHFHGEIAFWTEALRHPNYDAFWQSRNLLPHLNKVAPAVMTVGGWFDAEDLYGPLKIYREVEQRNPDIFNVLVMGPWSHGGWARGDGDRLGNVSFGAKNSLWYREQVELPFFEHFLKDAPAKPPAEATVFETGVNRWRMFLQWPPAEAAEKALYLAAEGGLSWTAPADSGGFDQYISDPARPVPFTEDISTGMTREYMTDDQRFAARRPDVLVYQTGPLTESLTLAGPIQCDLWVSTSAADADFVVKLIDVFPPDAPDWDGMESDQSMGSYQMLVRSEAIRGRFRNSYEKPEPFPSNQPTYVDLELLDVLHTFQPGHRLMVQIQSTWFPLMDRNPHKWVDNINFADEADFIPATIRVYRGAQHATRLRVGVLPPSGG